MSPRWGGVASSMELQGTPPKFLDLPAASDSTPGKLVAWEFRESLGQSSTLTLPLVTTPALTAQCSGRIHARHYAYHCRGQVRPLRGTWSEVSFTVSPLPGAPLTETPPRRQEAYTRVSQVHQGGIRGPMFRIWN